MDKLDLSKFWSTGNLSTLRKNNPFIEEMLIKLQDRMDRLPVNYESPEKDKPFLSKIQSMIDSEEANEEEWLTVLRQAISPHYFRENPDSDRIDFLIERIEGTLEDAIPKGGVNPKKHKVLVDRELSIFSSVLVYGNAVFLAALLTKITGFWLVGLGSLLLSYVLIRFIAFALNYDCLSLRNRKLIFDLSVVSMLILNYITSINPVTMYIVPIILICMYAYILTITKSKRTQIHEDVFHFEHYMMYLTYDLIELLPLPALTSVYDDMKEIFSLDYTYRQRKSLFYKIREKKNKMNELIEINEIVSKWED